MSTQNAMESSLTSDTLSTHAGLKLLVSGIIANIVFVLLLVTIKASILASLCIGADRLVNSSAIKSNLLAWHEMH